MLLRDWLEITVLPQHIPSCSSVLVLSTKDLHYSDSEAKICFLKKGHSNLRITWYWTNTNSVTQHNTIPIGHNLSLFKYLIWQTTGKSANLHNLLVLHSFKTDWKQTKTPVQLQCQYISYSAAANWPNFPHLNSGKIKNCFSSNSRNLQIWPWTHKIR